MPNTNIKKEVLDQLIANKNVGLAIFSNSDLSLIYQNMVLNDWLGYEKNLTEFIPKFNLKKLEKKIRSGRSYVFEIEVKNGSRSKILKFDFSLTDKANVIATVTDSTKEKETEFLLDSYVKMAEKNKRQLERSIATIKAQKQELKITNRELERERNNVELRALQAVINPHFVSNCLASIQGFIVDRNIEEAVNYLSHFGNLMRLSFDQSYYDYVSIREIIHILETYVRIEKMRIENSWVFSLEIDEAIDTGNSKIPPLLIQPFLENAIWHGINKKKGEGKISLKMVLLDELTLKCTVEDNGVGRSKSGKAKSEASLHSLNVTGKRLDILWQEHNKKYDIVYTDLYNSSQLPSGTKVDLFIPINF